MNTAKAVSALIDKWKSSGAEPWRVAWSAALLCVDWPYVFGAWGEECTPSARRRRAREDHPTIRSSCQVIREQNPVSSCSGCKWYPGGETVRCFDCRGFTDWCLKQAGIDLKGEGATSQWNTSSNWLRKGDISTMPQNTLVCLFVKKGEKMSHTGLGLNNETVECSSGVQHFTARNKKWTHWALPRGLYESSGSPDGSDSGAPLPGVPESAARPTLRLGAKGAAVRELQTLLLKAGESLPRWGADGDFGAETLAAVRSFQRKHGLIVDGVAGKNTFAELEQVTKEAAQEPVPVPAARFTVHIPGLSGEAAEALMAQYPDAWKTDEGGESE